MTVTCNYLYYKVRIWSSVFITGHVTVTRHPNQPTHLHRDRIYIIIQYNCWYLICLLSAKKAIKLIEFTSSIIFTNWLSSFFKNYQLFQDNCFCSFLIMDLYLWGAYYFAQQVLPNQVRLKIKTLISVYILPPNNTTLKR